MRRIPLAVVLVLFTTGCAPQDPKAKMRDAGKRYNDAADLLVTVKDAQSFENAKPKLKRFFAWEREQQRQSKKQPTGNRQPTQEEMQRAMNVAADLMNSPEFQEMTKAGMRYMGENMRCQLEVPGFKEFYEREMRSR